MTSAHLCTLPNALDDADWPARLYADILATLWTRPTLAKMLSAEVTVPVHFRGYALKGPFSDDSKRYSYRYFPMDPAFPALGALTRTKAKDNIQRQKPGQKTEKETSSGFSHGNKDKDWTPPRTSYGEERPASSHKTYFLFPPFTSTVQPCRPPNPPPNGTALDLTPHLMSYHCNPRPTSKKLHLIRRLKLTTKKLHLEPTFDNDEPELPTDDVPPTPMSLFGFRDRVLQRPCYMGNSQLFSGSSWNRLHTSATLQATAERGSSEYVVVLVGILGKACKLGPCGDHYLGSSKPFEGKSKFVVVLEPLPLPPFVEDWEAFTRAATTIQASCPLTPLCADCPYPLVRGSDTPSIVLKAPVSVPSSIPCTNHPADPEGYWKDILRQPTWPKTVDCFGNEISSADFATALVTGAAVAVTASIKSYFISDSRGKSITHTLALETIRLLEPAGTIHIPVSTVSKESDWLLNL
ncbi:hypothetical protein DFS34DRAFT_596300 [Phlyctochytrium arcticum]|nr:hypothetical protein DFS34DRAFT_596300 [Phlyctochytrium arcticum]